MLNGKPMTRRSIIDKVPIWVREALIALAIGAAVLLVVAQLRRAGQVGDEDAPRTPAPDFVVTDLTTGRAVRLADLRGKPAILNFWATWCSVCRADLPDLDALWRRSGGRFHVLAISAEAPPTLRAYVRDHGLTVPVLADPGGRAQQAYGVEAFPTLVILDADGRRVHGFAGAPVGDVLVHHMARLGAPPD